MKQSIEPRIVAAALILGLLVLCLTAAPTDAADAVEKKYLEIREAYQEFLKKPFKDRRSRDAWMKHINALYSIRKKYPKHERADDSLYWIGHAYRQMYEVSLVKSDLEEAIKTYQELIAKLPSSNLADDVSIYIAEIYETKLDNKRKAYEAYTAAATSFRREI